MTILDPDTLGRDARYWRAMADSIERENRIWLWTPKTRPAHGPCDDDASDYIASVAKAGAA